MIIIRLLLVCVLCLSVVPAAADDPAQANRLLVEAVRLIQGAEAEKAAAEKLPLLESALAKLNEIVEEHPATDLAVKLITGQQIGNLSLASVQEAIETLRLEANQATAEARRGSCLDAVDFSDPICLIVYAQEVEHRIQDRSQRMEALAMIARAQAVSGDAAGAERTVGRALAVGEKIVSQTFLGLDMYAAFRLILSGTVHAYSGDLQNALSGIVSELPNALRNIQDPVRRHRMLFLGVLGLASSGSLPEVILTMLKEQDDAWVRVRSLTDAAMKQALLGHVEESLATAEIVLSEVEGAEWFAGSDASLAVGALVLALSGDLGDEVRASVGEIWDSWAREVAHIAVALSHARAGNAQEAQAALNKVRSTVFGREESLSGVGLMLALTGNLQEDLEGTRLAEPAGDIVSQIRFFTSLAVLQSGTGGKPPDQMIPARPDMPTLRSRAMRQFVVAQIKSGNLQAASAIADSIADASIGKEMRDEVARLQRQVDLTAQAEDYIASGSFEDALKVAKQIEDVSVRDPLLGHAAVGFLRESNFEDALGTVKQIEDVLARDSLLDDIARGLMRQGNFEDALGVVDLIEDDSDRELILSDVAGGLLGQANLEGALAVAQTITSLEIQGQPLAMAVQFQARNGDLEGALATARAIQHANSRDRGLLVVVEARVAGEDEDAAKTLAIVKGIETAAIHDQALAAIFDRQLQDGAIEAAWATAKLMRTDHFREGALEELSPVQTQVAIRQVQAGDLQGAQDTARRIEDVQARDQVFARITQAQVDGEDLEGAVSTARLMRDQDRRDSARDSVIRVHVRNGNLESAAAVAHLIEDDKTHDERLGGIAQAQVEGGDLQGAVSAAALMHDVDRRDLVRGVVVNVHMEAAEFQKALAIAHLIENDRRHDERLGDIAQAQVEAKDFQAAVSTAALMHDEGPRDAVRNKVVVAHLKSGNLESALAIAQLIGNNRTQHKRIHQVANARIDAGELETALATAELLDEGRRDSVRNKVVAAHLKSKDLDSALAIAQLIGHERTRYDRIHQVANARIGAGELETALATAELLDEGRRDSVRNKVAKAHLKSGNLENALAIAQLIGHERTRYERIHQVANARIGAGEMETALATAELLDEGRRDAVRNKVAKAHLKSKDLEKALAIAGTIVHTGTRDTQYYYIAEGQINAGDLEKALSTAELIERQDWRDSIRSAAEKARQ